MRISSTATLTGLLRAALFACTSLGMPHAQDSLTSDDGLPVATTISIPFFSELERLARLVDISYCVGTTGVSKPFKCVSRCKEFPTLSLVNSWNTGILMSDSCGYIAIDHGESHDTSDQDSPEGAGDVGTQAIYVAFRGTYSISNTVVDLSTVPQKYVPYPSPDPDDGSDVPERQECHNCTVHLGFFQSWESARKLVLPELVALKREYPSYPIHLVGHSLGDAVACLAALELKVSMGWSDIVVTTFGEPRVGNNYTARFIDQVFGLDKDVHLEDRSYRRVTHVNDPVPLLPLEEWGYRQHGGEVYITKDSLSPSDSDVRTCVGDYDSDCSSGDDNLGNRYKLWELFFAHRDYFWRLGLCVPGGDPWNWGRDSYDFIGEDEL
jgi:hypothetical protein